MVIRCEDEVSEVKKIRHGIKSYAKTWGKSASYIDKITWFNAQHLRECDKNGVETEKEGYILTYEREGEYNKYEQTTYGTVYLYLENGVLLQKFEAIKLTSTCYDEDGNEVDLSAPKPDTTE